MKRNEGGIDRVLRIVVGVALIVAGLGFLDGKLGVGVALFGLVPLLTGIAGRCPAYALFGVRTCSMGDDEKATA